MRENRSVLYFDLSFCHPSKRKNLVVQIQASYRQMPASIILACSCHTPELFVKVDAHLYTHLSTWPIQLPLSFPIPHIAFCKVKVLCVEAFRSRKHFAALWIVLNSRYTNPASFCRGTHSTTLDPARVMQALDSPSLFVPYLIKGLRYVQFYRSLPLHPLHYQQCMLARLLSLFYIVHSPSRQSGFNVSSAVFGAVPIIPISVCQRAL